VAEALTLLLALFIDLAIGEYPAPVHPVVWMGGVITAGLKLAPRRSRAGQLIYGALLVGFVVALFSLPVYFLLRYINSLSALLGVVAAAFILKATFSFSELRRAGQGVQRRLERGELAEARRQTALLVSRDTSRLEAPYLSSAVVEMTAESLTDAVVSPLFYWLLLGVPGALAYRAVNTLDARIGYHGGCEYLGKAAARLDDALNFIPARLSALLLAAAAALIRRRGKESWRLMLRQHGRTESPNAGWTMAAVAGALGVSLEKPGVTGWGRVITCRFRLI
jgi:adenosylcobinamide-phosphate synthase